MVKMTEYKTTVVTMFFNLKEFPDASKDTRPFTFYLEHGRQTLGLKNPMVIFCDSATVEYIKPIRDEEAPGVPTEYVVKSVTEYDFYQRAYGIVRENRSNSEHYRSRPDDRNTASYLLLMMMKPTAIRYAHEKNFFNTSFYAWVDLGSSHIVRYHKELCPKMLADPGPKVRACYINYRSKEELASMERFMAAGGPCGMACTIYTVEAGFVNRFYCGMFSVFYEMLLKGVGHNDEQIMTYCYDRYPELFSLYYGDYYSILANYHSAKEDHHAIRWYFIERAKQAGRGDLAADAARSVVRALDEGLVLSQEQEAFYRSLGAQLSQTQESTTFP